MQREEAAARGSKKGPGHVNAFEALSEQVEALAAMVGQAYGTGGGWGQDGKGVGRLCPRGRRVFGSVGSSLLLDSVAWGLFLGEPFNGPGTSVAWPFVGAGFRLCLAHDKRLWSGFGDRLPLDALGMRLFEGYALVR